MIRIGCVFVGGGLGSVVRYLIGKAILQSYPLGNFATGTFAVNVTGSFLIGLLMAVFVERLRLPQYFQLLFVTGFLGGYTTFSTFEYDAYLSVRGGHLLGAAFYLVSSVVAGLSAVYLGSALAGRR